MWVIGGMVNTCSYMVAPTCCEPHHKAAANGLLAIAYQTAPTALAWLPRLSSLPQCLGAYRSVHMDFT